MAAAVFPVEGFVILVICGMSSPIRSFLNLLALVSVAGVVLWRENYWQVKLRQNSREAPPVTLGDVATATEGREMDLLSENGSIRKKLVAAEARASDLAMEVQKLKQAVEAARPIPTPDDLAKQLATQRGLAFDPPPVWTPAPLEEILTKIRTTVEAQLPVDSAEARSRAAVAMGFHPDPYNYRDALVSLAQMTNGGFYDSAGNTFFYREEASLDRADGRETFIGGLASALTLRKGGGLAGNLYDPVNDDVALAARSLISGDANASRVRFSIADQLNLNFDRSGAPAAPPPNYSAPAYLAEIWKFSQDKGSLFVETLTGRGGNAAVDAAYARMPRSSAEILHPEELYFANPPFTPVEVSLGEAVVGGVNPYFANTAGEFGTYAALRSWLDADLAAITSEGWAGDRYATWAGEEGLGDHFYWKSVWRTGQDAKEFFDQVRRVVMQRFSIPWQQAYDAVPDQFRVDDPRRIVRLVLNPGEKTVTFSHATDPAFAEALEKTSQAW